MENESQEVQTLVHATANIVASYVGVGSKSPEEVIELTKRVYTELKISSSVHKKELQSGTIHEAGDR